MMLRLSRPAVVSLLILALVALAGTVLAVRNHLGADSLSSTETARTPLHLDGRRRQLIGVRLARVTRESLTRTVGAVGIVRYDETRLTDFNLKLEGWIRELSVSHVGQHVRAGQPLFTFYSPELDALQGNLIGALKAREQTSPLPADSSTYGDRQVDAPRQRLKQFDVAEEELRTLERTREIPAGVPFRSPTNGVVIETAVVKGMHVERGRTLYKIADLSVVVVEADFREADAAFLKAGSRVEITLDALPGQRFEGRIVTAYPYLSEETRTLKARIELPNPGERLKPGMYANVDLRAVAAEGLLVPADAVVDSGSRQIVFVSQGDGYFEPRQVTVGAKMGDKVQVLDGLQANDEIATRATFLLDSESQMHAALQNYEATPVRSGPARADGDLKFSVEVTPDPPRTGENVLRVRLTQMDGRAVTDADIRVRLSMPPMPTMNMPGMRSDARLVHVRDGVYSGSASLSMAGRWDVTVTALRQGQSIAETRTSLVAR